MDASVEQLKRRGEGEEERGRERQRRGGSVCVGNRERGTRARVCVRGREREWRKKKGSDAC